MSRHRRVLGVSVATALLAIALVYTVRPFTVTVAVPGSNKGRTTLGVAGECRAAVLSAPGGSRDELALWAVTIGTDRSGFVTVPGDKLKFVRLGSGELPKPGTLPDGFCATRARERLATSAIFLIGAGLAVLLAFRRRRPAPT